MRADLLLKLLSKTWLAFFFKWQDEDDNKEDWAIFKNHHPDKSHNMTRMGFIIFAPAHDLNDRTVWQTVNMFCVSYSRIGYNRYYIHHKIKNGTWICKWDFELHKSPQTSPSQVRYGFINDLETVLWWNVLFSNALIMSRFFIFSLVQSFLKPVLYLRTPKKWHTSCLLPFKCTPTSIKGFIFKFVLRKHKCVFAFFQHWDVSGIRNPWL